MKKSILMGIAISLVSNVVYAHPGHGVDIGFMSGFTHPWMGWDHLLMMLAVGIWAANMGGSARWQLPLMFVSTMLIGALLGSSAISINGVEPTIAAGLLALGVVLMTHLAMHRTTQLLFTAFFALMHGLAHGGELSQHANASLALPLLGMVLATAVLHALGYGIGLQKNRLLALVQPLLAGLMLGLGANLLLSI